MAEIIEALEGCIRILENMDEEERDSRCFVIIRALRSCIVELDDIAGNAE